MFDIASSEFLLIAIVAIVVIGPKDLPMALRTAGKWIGTVRRVSGHFRTGLETMIREAELEEMEKKWRDQNAAIMTAHPEGAAIHEASAEAAVHALPPPDEVTMSATPVDQPPAEPVADAALAEPAGQDPAHLPPAA